MKKNLLLSVLSLGVLVGMVSCGGDPSSSGASSEEPVVKTDVELLVWAAAEEEPVLKNAVTYYNGLAASKYNITYTFASVGEGDVANEMIKNVDEGADLFFFADDHVLKLQGVNALSPVVGDAKDWVEDTMTASGVSSSVFAGQMVAYPATVSNLWFAYYDNQYLTADDVKSLETILAKAKEAGKKVYLPLDTGWYCFPSWFLGADIYWTTKADGTHGYTTNMDSTEFVTRLSYVNELLAGYYKDGTLVQGQAMGGVDESIFTLDGSWNYNNYLEKLPNTLATATTPTYTVDSTTYQMGSYLGAKLLGVNGAHSAAKQEAAHALAQVLLNKEFSLQRYEARQMIPVNVDALSDARYTSNKTPAVSAMEAQMKIAGFSQSATCQGSVVWDIQAAIGKALYGNNSAADPDTGIVSDWAAFLKNQADALKADSF